MLCYIFYCSVCEGGSPHIKTWICDTKSRAARGKISCSINRPENKIVHVDLAKNTGATIVFGPGASTSYDAHIATDNEEFKIGDVTIKVLHTPGHTMESSTFLLIDENGKNHASL